MKRLRQFHSILYFLFLFLCCEPVLNFVHSAEEKKVIFVSDDEIPHWRYWGKEEDGGVGGVHFLSVDINENAYIKKARNTFLFDGKEFSPQKPLKISQPYIRSGIDNQYWVQNNCEIEIYDGRQILHYDLSDFMELNKDDFPNQHDRSISLQKNQFYILSNQGLYLFNIATQQFDVIKKVEETKLMKFLTIHTNFTDTVWIAGEKGVAEINITGSNSMFGKEWAYYSFPISNCRTTALKGVYPHREISFNLREKGTNYNQLYRLKSGQWTLLHAEIDTEGWLGHDEGFWIKKSLDDSTKQFQFHTHNKIYIIQQDKFTIDPIYTISQNKHSFWITSKYGLTYFRAPTWRRDESIPKNDAIYHDGLFLSPNDYFLYNNSQLLVKKNNQWNVIELAQRQPRGDSSICIINHPNDDQKKWLFSGRSLFEYDPEQPEPVKKLINFDEAFHAYFIDQESNIFLGFDEFDFNIAWLENLNLHPVFQYHAKATHLPFNTFVVQNNGAIWFLDKGKLHYVMNGQQESIPHFEDSGVKNVWNVFRRNNDHIILVGNNGVFEFDGNQYIQLSDENFGNTTGFLETDEQVDWFATHEGLHRFQDGIWVENNWQEGLTDSRYRFVKSDESGNIYLGSDMGMRRFHPEMDTDPPDTSIPELENDKKLLPGNTKRIQLRGKDRWDYTKPNRLLYSYKINESDWSDFQESNIIQLSHLHQRENIIYARAMDRNFNIDPTPASFQFQVALPWFKEPFFFVIFSVGTCLILFFGYYAVRNHQKLVSSLNKTQKTVELLEHTKIRLIDAKTRAEAATKAKDSFLARMSHEIRTPLNGIIGNLELLPQSRLYPKEQSYLQTAKVSANTLMEIIGDVLDFAKIEAGKLELEHKPVSLPALFEETISVMATRAEDKGILLGSNLSSDVPQAVRIDPIRMRQVMMNLIGNAIKFTDQGSVDVLLHCSDIIKYQAKIRFEVKDTGVGFDASRKENLFREFEQDDTSNKTAEGTGLGLSICKRIIEMMGGLIDCESQTGKGSSFWFEIPVQIVDESELEQPSFVYNVIDGFPRFELEHPILIIDDKETNRLLAKNQLNNLGIEPDTAGGGLEALDKIQSNTYSMLLVDCSMPGMDGFEFTRRFRSYEKNMDTHIPVIAMTAHVASNIRDRCHAAGMDDYLSKPVKIESMIEIIQKWMPPNQEISNNTKSSIEPHDLDQYSFSLENISQFTSIEDPEELMQFLQVVSQEIMEEYDKLIHAVSQKDKRTFLAQAHSLKGLAGPIQLTYVADMMNRFHSQADNMNWNDVENTLPEIQQWILKFQKSIQTINSTVTNETF